MRLYWEVGRRALRRQLAYRTENLAGIVTNGFTFVVPLAFVSYEPALYLLGRPDPLGLPDVARLLSPLAAIIMALLARYGWQQGVRHYQGTGS